jgi:PAS domain S-box-containing protein
VGVDVRVEALLEAGPDALLLVQPDGRIAYANGRAEQLFGYERGELIGCEVEVLVPPASRAQHALERTQYTADPRPRPMRSGLELAGVRKDGSEFPLDISLSPLRQDDEVLIFTVMRDATDRKEAEQERLRLALAEATRAEAEAARARLVEIMRDLDAIVWESDSPERTRFTFVSGRAEEMLGYSAERWLGEDDLWRRLIHSDDRERATLFFRESMATGDTHELEYRLEADDGRTVWVRDIVRAVDDAPGGSRARGVMIDVTERHDLNERLLHSQKLEAIGQLAGGIAHDFNNLLTVISGFSNLLAARVDQTLQGEVTEIRRAAERAASLTRQLLAFSRRDPSTIERLDVSELVHGLEEMLQRLIGEDYRLELATAPTPALVDADPRRLEQVIVNLAVNARDAMPEGGRIRIETSTLELDRERAAEREVRAGTFVCLVVSDTGTGMSDATMSRIFEPFFTTKAEGKGTGLGLATVYGIVEEAGGRIDVESDLGRGTVFTILLPSAAPLAVEEEAEYAGTILVVEDEPALRKLARVILEDERYRVLEAGSGREALEVAERHAGPIDLLLTDVVMPGLSGTELVAQLSRLRPEVSVVYMSGYADTRLAGRGLADDSVLLYKPFAPDELATTVRAVLAGRR